jgi:hypothetical protein
MRGEREVRPTWSAIYAILMSMSPSRFATGAVAQSRLWLRICDFSQKWCINMQFQPHECVSGCISVTPVTFVRLQSQHVILVTCWPFVLEIAPLSITYDVIACQSSTILGGKDHPQQGFLGVMFFHLDARLCVTDRSDQPQRNLHTIYNLQCTTWNVPATTYTLQCTTYNVPGTLSKV